MGFHTGELEVQRLAGVALDAARLERMLDPAELSAGVARFLSERTLVAVTARDAAGHLWVSPLAGDPGFVAVTSATTFAIHALPGRGDPLHELPPGQPLAMIALDYERRRRFRLNGTLETVSGDLLSIRADEAFGNCPQFIPQRSIELLPAAGLPRDVRDRDVTLSVEDRAAISRADTFILGTTHPDRGNDASHRGGPPGFVRTEEAGLWWPDYPGNNLFNSLGNLSIDPEAALLFLDLERSFALHLTGTAELETTTIGAPGDDGRTGRRVRFTPSLVVRSPLAFRVDT